MIAQILAIAIFIAMFIMIIIDKFERHIVTLASGALVLVLVFGLSMHSMEAVGTTINLNSLFHIGFWYGASEGESTSGINWATIIFIAGMMIMVEGLGKVGFFRWLCLTLAKLVHYHVVPLLICFMTMSAVLSMFIDSITVVLFLAVVTTELARILHFNPVPLIISEIFCANLGGAATMCGDPPNIIIGTALGYTFMDFVTHVGIIVVICFAVIATYFFLCFRKQLKKSELERPDGIEYPQPSSAIDSKTEFIVGVLIFAAAVALLTTHAQTELSVAFIGVIVALLTLISMLITSGIKGVKIILKELDYKTLLFFIGLFISVSGLEETGVLTIVAKLITQVSGGNLTIIVAIILYLSAVASAIVDNIPFAATMVPVIRAIASTQGVSLPTLAWALSLGTDLGGNATPIGASANVVGTSVAAKQGHPIGWGQYCKYCVPATIIVVGISMFCLYVLYL